MITFFFIPGQIKPKLLYDQGLSGSNTFAVVFLLSPHTHVPMTFPLEPTSLCFPQTIIAIPIPA